MSVFQNQFLAQWVVMAEGRQWMPLRYQIACIVLFALFIWSFSIAREPRGWRRLFQARFSRSGDFSVNKNKVIDENLKKYGIVVAMVLLVSTVICFVLGLSQYDRDKIRNSAPSDNIIRRDLNRINADSPAENRRSIAP